MPSSFDFVRYLTTDPLVVGLVGWGGLIISVGGFAIAIGQIRSAKSAALATQKAVRGLSKSIFGRERLLELSSAVAHINNARDRITQGRNEPALVFLDFAVTECVQIHELLDILDRKRLYKFIVRLRKLTEELSTAEAQGATEDMNLAFALEARSIVEGLNELAAKLRYSYSGEGL